MKEREYPRYAHEAAVSLRTADIVVSGHTANVSRGGLCATLGEPLSVGAQLEVDIQLVFEDDRHSEPLRLPGLVVWCTAVDDGYQIGVRFQAVSNEIADDLTMFLRYLGGTAATKTDTRFVPLDERFG